MGWVIVNILLPAFAPIVLMLLFFRPLRKRFPADAQKLINFLSPIKDGQLSWAGLAFCAAGLYEMHEAAHAVQVLGDTLHGVFEGLLIFGLLGNSFLAAEGAIFPAEQPRPANVTFNDNYPVLAWSIAFSTISGILFAVVHFKLNP